MFFFLKKEEEEEEEKGDKGFFFKKKTKEKKKKSVVPSFRILLSIPLIFEIVKRKEGGKKKRGKENKDIDIYTQS